VNKVQVVERSKGLFKAPAVVGLLVYSVHAPTLRLRTLGLVLKGVHITRHLLDC
jgi:hypothetical protein